MFCAVCFNTFGSVAVCIERIYRTSLHRTAPHRMHTVVTVELKILSSANFLLVLFHTDMFKNRTSVQYSLRITTGGLCAQFLVFSFV